MDHSTDKMAVDPNNSTNPTEPENRGSIESPLSPPPPPHAPTRVDCPESSTRAKLGTVNTAIANEYPSVGNSITTIRNEYPYPPIDVNSTTTNTNRYPDPPLARTKYMNYRCLLKYQNYVYSSYFPANPTTTTPYHDYRSQPLVKPGDAMSSIVDKASEKHELLYELEHTNPSTGEDSSDDKIASEMDLLTQLLILKQRKMAELLKLQEDMKLLGSDIELVKIGCAFRNSSYTKNTNTLWQKSLDNFSQLESAYFSLRSNARPNETPETDRTDTDVLRTREDGSRAQPQPEPKRPDTRLGALCDSIYKLCRFNKFILCGILKNSDTLNPNKLICSLCFDRDEEYVASAGLEKKIKIFKIGSFLYTDVNVRYPVLEMSNESKITCISWSTCIRNHLVSSDFDGLVQTWDTGTGVGIARYKEHQKRLWSVDFSRVDPMKFASGGDDCSVRLWSTNERNSVGVIRNQATVCCVQYSAYSSHLLAFGSSDQKIRLYDLRHTRIPWCTIAGHGDTVSYVRFLNSETLVSACKDSTLKLWDLNKTNSVGLSTNACRMTFTGHKNQKYFVGMAVSDDGYIATGSETNEVYAYDTSFPTPIATHRLDDPTVCTNDFVSSVCWRTKSRMLVAGNSSGNTSILRMVN